MIIFVTSARHAYTHSCLEKERETIEARVISWDQALKDKDPPRATYVLTDFDRIAPWLLYEAGTFYLDLLDRGFRVLNNPARAASRGGLLRTLYRRKINDFDAYRLEEQVMPSRWPVFLRCEGHHGPPLSGLIDTLDALKDHIALCLSQGVPVSSLLIIEYAAEFAVPGVFRKLSVYRVGERFLGFTSVFDDQWVVKHGKKGIAPPALFEEEYICVRDNPYEAFAREVFALAGIEYGRLDFGLVGGKPQLYEINNNPHLVLRPEKSQIELRNQSDALFTENYLAAIKAIDTSA